MAFTFHDFFRGQHRADWVDLSLVVMNFKLKQKSLRCKVRVFQAQGWNRHPKEILSVNVSLKRRINSVRFENLPIGIPLYIHVSGACVLADADEDGLLTGLDQFLGRRAQVRLVAKQPSRQELQATVEVKQRQKQLARAQSAQTTNTRQTQMQHNASWATGPRRFQKMHSLTSRKSLVALEEIDNELTSIEIKAKKKLTILGNLERSKKGGVDLGVLQEELYDLDDALEELYSDKLSIIDLRGLYSGATQAASKKQALLARANQLASDLRQALMNPLFPSESDDSTSDEQDESNDGSESPSKESTTQSLANKIQCKERPSTMDINTNEDSTNKQQSDLDFAPTAKILSKTKASHNTLPVPALDLDNNNMGKAETAVSSQENSIAPPIFGRKYSTLSQQRLVKLEDIRHRVDVIKSEFEGLTSILDNLDSSTVEGADSRLKIKDECAQLYGNLEKLQFKEIDAVLVGDLTSGKDDARAKRKQLTRDVSDLTDRVHEIVENIKKYSAVPTSS